VGVNKGAFSKSVSEAYWGDVIPEAYQTAKQLINNIRITPGEGSRYTYVNLEKLAKRWGKRTKKATKLEPISKSPEEDNEASELYEAEEVLGVVFPTDEDAALPLNPSKEALHKPASHIAA